MVCYRSVCVPPQEDRNQIVIENYESKIGGHTGINKTYGRMRAKTDEPIIIMGTHIDTSDKASLETVGPLPIPPDGN